jgi:hypothetical protein
MLFLRPDASDHHDANDGLQLLIGASAPATAGTACVSHRQKHVPLRRKTC